MKKLKMFLTIMVLVISSTVMSQTYHMKASHLVISDGVNTESYDTSVDLKLDVTTSRLTIYSKEIQVIDYEELRDYVDEDNYAVIECTATDTNYKRMGLEILLSLDINKILVVLEYRDFSYVYVCKKI